MAITVNLSYVVCTASPWDPRLDEVGQYTLKQRKLPEELKREREFFKANNYTRKPNPYKYLKQSVISVENNTGYFLLGTWHKLQEKLDKLGIDYTVNDQCDKVLMPDPDYEALRGYDFRPGQLDAIAAIATSKGGVICSTVGFGKSFIIKLLCKIYPTLNILVVCAAGEVVRELYRAINEELPGQAGLLNMDSDNVSGKRIIVTTSKSMTKVKPEQVQLVLVDEAHNYGDNTSGQELMKFCYARRFGFTATPIRNQGA